MSAPERGRCGGCGGGFIITAKGLIRSHVSWRDGSHPVSGKCVGSGMPAIGPDEPLLYTEVRDLRRENAELREALGAARAEADAWRHRAASADTLIEVNQHLHAAVTASLKMMSSTSSERHAKFEAEMAALREKYPTLRAPARRP